MYEAHFVATSGAPNIQDLKKDNKVIRATDILLFLILTSTHGDI